MKHARFLYRIMVILLILTVVMPGSGRRRVDALASAAQASYKLKTSVIGAAGSPATGAAQRGNGTLGQPSAIGICEAADDTGYIGFWKSAWAAWVTEAGETPTARNDLYQNYPNPFNPVTTIEYSIAREGLVDLRIYSVKGELIRRLVCETKPIGRHRATWDGRNDRGIPVSTGIYFYRLRSGSFTAVRKMLILR